MVLTIGGHDPIGGAGIQADSESIAANGCHACSALTCLTVQDSCEVRLLQPVTKALLDGQIEALFGDCRIAAIKLGLIGDAGLVATLAGILRRHRQIPLVIDPILAAGGGGNLASAALVAAMREQLLPLADLITPNSLEARRLCGAELPLPECAGRLLESGAGAVLITGTHEQEEAVVNRLYDHNGLLDASSWPRLPGSYHGSGCTLAAAISAGLARGLPLIEAVQLAQAYSWHSLERGFRAGRCQALPDRLFRLQRGHA